MNNESLRQLGAKHWQIVISLLAVVSAAAKFSYDVVEGPLTLKTWIPIGAALITLIVIRFDRVATTLTRLILGSPPIPTDPPSIFRGPLPYLKGEQLPGRHAEVDRCLLLLQRYPFFVLEGESGCGKTSILNAALLPGAREKYRVAECRVVSDPMGKVVSTLLQQPYQQVNQFPTREDFGNSLRSAIPTYAASAEVAHPTKPLLLCIDQFEELFVTVKDELRFEFLSVLRDAIESGQLRLLLSIRNDFRDLLMDLCRKVDPTHQILDLGAAYYTLESFSEDQAITVLIEMLEPIHGGDPVRRQVHDDFANKLVLELLRPPRDPRLYPDDVKTVLPVELQIVGIMIESVGIQNFSVDGLRQLGGKTALIRKYVEEAKEYVWRKTAISGDQALLVLRQLISPARTKWSRTPEVISKDLNIPAIQAQNVLDAFAERFLVKRLPDEPGTLAQQDGHRRHTEARYELMHEHLVRVLVEAPQPILQKARDAEERLQFWRKRTSDIYSLLDEAPHRPALLGLIREKIIQPIPLMEIVKVWRFATSREDRQMLRRSLRGFSFRLGSVAVVLSILLGSWVLYTRSDSYQVATIVGKAPVDQFAGADSPTQVVEWIKALVYANNTKAAFEAARKIKKTDERSKAFAVACLELTALDDFATAKAAMEESLSIERFSWDTLHSEAIATLVPHLSPQQLDTMRSRPFEDHGARTQLLAAVAEGLFRAGKNEQASQVFAEALTDAKLIHDSQPAFGALTAVATRLIHDKRIQDANTLLEIAASMAQGINDRNEKFDALLTAAEDYAKIGNSDKAADVLKEALSLDPNGWNGQDSESIISVAEGVGKGGNGQTILDIVRKSQLQYFKTHALAATATGLSRASQDDEVLPIFDEITSNGEKFDALVDAAGNSIENSRFALAKRLLERASLLLSQPLDIRLPRNPWNAVAMGFLRVNEIDKAVEIGRLYERTVDPSLGVFYMRGDEQIRPLAQVVRKLAEEGQVDKAYNISKDIKVRLDRYHALTAIILAHIKAGNFAEATRVRKELDAIPRNEENIISSTSDEAQLPHYLTDIAVALAGAGKLDDALVIVQSLKKADDKYTAFERIAKELMKLGKVPEAINVIDRSDQVLKSRSLANLVEWLLDTDKSDTIPRILPLIEYGDDKSRANAALAKMYARSGALRLARYTADSCTSQSDQLSAYTVILNEYGKRQNPKVLDRLKTASLAEVQTASPR